MRGGRLSREETPSPRRSVALLGVRIRVWFGRPETAPPPFLRSSPGPDHCGALRNLRAGIRVPDYRHGGFLWRTHNLRLERKPGAEKMRRNQKQERKEEGKLGNTENHKTKNAKANFPCGMVRWVAPVPCTALGSSNSSRIYEISRIKEGSHFCTSPFHWCDQNSQVAGVSDVKPCVTSCRR